MPDNEELVLCEIQFCSSLFSITFAAKNNSHMFQTWFECKVKYLKVDEDGRERQVTDNFLLDAISFTDAETRIISIMQSMVRGEFMVTDIRKSKIAEVFPYEVGEWWFRATINLIAIDEEAGKEKKLRSTYLVQADNIREALARIDESLSFLIVPYVVSALAVSTIADVFPYTPGALPVAQPENPAGS